MASIVDILLKKFPGTQWAVTDNDYNSLVWHEGNTIPKPSTEEIFQYDEEVDLLVKWDNIRLQRNGILNQTDWTQLPDSPFSTEKKAEWATYRQQLRDITIQFVNPEQVVWPPQPI